jgi:hypothetical protein
MLRAISTFFFDSADILWSPYGLLMPAEWMTSFDVAINITLDKSHF